MTSSRAYTVAVAVVYRCSYVPFVKDRVIFDSQPEFQPAAFPTVLPSFSCFQFAPTVVNHLRIYFVSQITLSELMSAKLFSVISL